MYKKLIIILVSTLIVGILAIIFTPSGFATGIYIKIPDGTDITLEVEPVDTVLSLKNKIPYKAIWTACKNYEKGAKSKGFRWKFKKVLNM